MKKKRISLSAIKEIMSVRDLKNTLGGSNSGGSSVKICYKCMNGNTGSCPTSDMYDECWDEVSEKCTSGWMSWESGKNGYPECE